VEVTLSLLVFDNLNWPCFAIDMSGLVYQNLPFGFEQTNFWTGLCPLQEMNSGVGIGASASYGCLGFYSSSYILTECTILTERVNSGKPLHSRSCRAMM